MTAILLIDDVEAQVRSFELPAQEATESPPEFARQAGIQISASAEALKGWRTPEIKGRIDLNEALSRLLAGSKLSIASQQDGIIILRKVPEGEAPPSHPADAEQRGKSPRPDGPAATPTDRTEATPEPTDESRHPGGPRSVEKLKLDEVLVTGTHIGGANPTSNVLTLTREDIDQQGFVSAEDLVRSLTFNRGAQGSQQRSTLSNQLFNSNSFAGLSSPDLRGLGPGTTLVLVNGRQIGRASCRERV